MSRRYAEFAICILLFLLLACKPQHRELRDSIRISVPYEVQTLDPESKDTISDFAIPTNFYDPLVRTDRDQKVRPCLSETWENPDLLTWIFHLRKTVKFHNGQPLTSQDVVYSFHRVLTDPTLDMKEYIENVTNVSAMDPYTVRIRTNSTANVFLQKLNFILIIPDGAKVHQLTDHVNGTGPYKFEAWKKNQSIEMIRNENYWGSKPQIGSVIFKLGRTPEQAMNDLQSGECQLVQCNSRNVKQVIDKKPEYKLLVHDSLFVKYLGFDTLRDDTPYCSVHPNPFKKLNVRKAINMAIDRKALISEIPTFAVPVSQPVPPFVFGYDPDIKLSPYDVATAKQLLSDSGYPNGFSVTLHVRRILSSTALLVRDQLAKIGIKVEVRILPDPDFYAAMDRHDSSMFITRLGCPTGDASDVLTMGIHSPDPGKRLGTKNFGGYSNPAIDQAIESSFETADDDKRGRFMQQLMAQLVDDVAWVPLYIDQEVYALNNKYSWLPRNDSYILAQEISLRTQTK